jgi:hypothetical protein
MEAIVIKEVNELAMNCCYKGAKCDSFVLFCLESELSFNFSQRFNRKCDKILKT